MSQIKWRNQYTCNALPHPKRFRHSVIFLEKSEFDTHFLVSNSNPAGKISRILRESPGIVVVGGGDPCGNLGCKWNENPCENEREVSQTCKHVNSPKNDIKSSLGYFHITGTLPIKLYCILKFWGETQGKSPRGNIPRDSTGKGGGNIAVENSP